MRNTGSIIKTTNIDDLNQRIRIFFYEYEQDDEGNFIAKKEITKKTCWAKVLPYASKISNGYAEQVNSVDYRVVIRYDKSILPTDLILWNDKVLQPISTPYDAESSKIWLVIECREYNEEENEVPTIDEGSL